MKQRLVEKLFLSIISTALCLIAMSIISVETSQASALGLADGTYNITLDFDNNTFDASGTITVGPTPAFVTSFHVGDFDCTGCTLFSSTPDFVSSNNGLEFQITSGSFILNLATGGDAVVSVCQGGGFCSPQVIATGDWSQVPEPMSSSLLLFGLSALGLWRGLRTKQE